MQQHLLRQVGVAKVNVSLVDGKVTIYPKEDSRFDAVGIFRAVYDSGVSVAEMAIVASGQLLNDPARGPVLRVGDSEEFEVKSNEVAQITASQVGFGKTLRIRGLLYRKAKGKSLRRPPTSMPLEILEVLH